MERIKINLRDVAYDMRELDFASIPQSSFMDLETNK